MADRHAVWSPDGSSIAWFNDDGDEYGLVITDQDGSNPRRIEIPEPSFYFRPEWSPDGSRLAFTDTHYRVLVLEAESGEVEHVDTDRFAHPERSMNPVWSPDSRWIAYARRLDNLLRAIFVHDTESGETRQLTDGMFRRDLAGVGRVGEVPLLLASTDYALNTGWLDMTSYDRPVTRALYLALLSADEPSPFLPRSDEEESGGEESDDEDEGQAESGETGRSGRGASSEGASGGGASADDPPEVIIDFDGLAGRIVDAPGLDMEDYAGLAPGPDGTVFVLEGGGFGGGAVLKYSIEEQEGEDFLERGGASRRLPRPQPAALLQRRLEYRRHGPSRPRAAMARLDLGGLRVRVEPRPSTPRCSATAGVHARLPVCGQPARGTVGRRMGLVLGVAPGRAPPLRLQPPAGHALGRDRGRALYVRGGDYPELESPRTGLLGADVQEEDGFYRITRIYNGGDWTPGLGGPLSHPGMDVQEGDYLLAVDGAELRAPTNPYRLLEGSAGRVITLTVASSPSAADARDIVSSPQPTRARSDAGPGSTPTRPGSTR